MKIKHETGDGVSAILCTECPRKFRTLAALGAHEKTAHTVESEPMPCPVCGVEYPKVRLDRHLITVHTVEESVSCDICHTVQFFKYYEIFHPLLHRSN